MCLLTALILFSLVLFSFKPPSDTNEDLSDDESESNVQLIDGISTSSPPPSSHHPDAKLCECIFTRKKINYSCLDILFLFFALIVAGSWMLGRSIRENALVVGQSCLIFHNVSYISKAMDLNVDPCTDFYEYSCNGWIKAGCGDTFNILQQNNYLVIKHILEQPIDTFKSKAEKKAKMFYDSCLDNDTVEALGARPMIELIETLGGWNITSSGFNVSDWTLQNTLQVIQIKYSIEVLFSYGVGEDDRNSTRHILQIDQSGLALPTRDIYLNKTAEHLKVLKAYLEYMTKVGVLLGGEQNSTQRQMQAVIDFETKLANITTSRDLRRDPESLYHLMALADLQERANFIDWREFFQNAMKVVQKKISPKEQIVVYAPEYLGNLTKLIQEYENTTEGKIILNNYLVWQTVKVFTLRLSKPFRDANNGLSTALKGSNDANEPRWKYCIDNTHNVLGFILGAIFVREKFDPDSKKPAEIMINNIRNAFKENFKNLNWMDEQTRRMVIDKANAILHMTGYPEFITDVNQLDERFDNLTLRPDTYFNNNLNVNIYNLRKKLEKVNEPVNKTTWHMAPSAVNAYYTRSKNHMVFPAGILQNPFYDPSFPPSLNYGALGVVMGHELTHGFDDQGRQYDKNGNLNHWWNNETIERFQQRTKCIVDQYNGYKINGKNINGNLTLGENIADNGGLKAAYHAYLNLMKDQPEPEKLPGLSLNHRQLFFVVFAQVYCSTVNEKATDFQIETDVHSPGKFRVNGAVSNLKEFSEEFQCKVGAKMNPQTKCEVW